MKISLSFNDMWIVIKINVIIVVFVLFVFGVVGFVSLRIEFIDTGYLNLVNNLDFATSRSARGNVFLQAYLSSAYQLGAETTQAGNSRLVTQARDARTTVEQVWSEA